VSKQVNTNNILPKEGQGLTEELEKLLDVVSMCRDINNDFRREQFKKELEEIENKALEVFKQQLFQQENRGKINLTIIGNFSSGKSSIINALLGSDVCAVKINPTTSSITRFVYGEEEKIFQIQPDGKRKEISKEEYLKNSQHKVSNMKRTKVAFFEYQYPSPLLEDIILSLYFMILQDLKIPKIKTMK